MSKRERIKAEEKVRIAKACIKGEVGSRGAAEQVGVHASVVDDWVRLYQYRGSGIVPSPERKPAIRPIAQEKRLQETDRRKPIDNGPMEGFWGILKRERYYGRRFTSRKELVRMIEDYIAYYNNRRVQRNLGVLTPMEKHNSDLPAA